MAEATGTDRVTERVHHALPGWVVWVQEHLMLSFLILCESYILGTLMCIGWVKNIENPATWGWFSGIGVALFFAGGMTAAGVALRCSVTAAEALGRRSVGLFLFNMLGLTVFSTAEIWASLSERSKNLQPTPADLALLHYLDLTNVAISPTVVIVAVLLPFATLFWGFSQQQHETAEERRERQDRKLSDAKFNAQLRTVQARGLGSMLRGAGQALASDQEVEDGTSGTATGDDGSTDNHPTGGGTPTGKPIPLRSRRNQGGVRTPRKPAVNQEAAARRAFANGAISVPKMQAATGMSRSTASGWVRTLKAERDTRPAVAQ